MHVVLEGVLRQISPELDGLNAELSQQHPGGKIHSWSMQQVVEHLVLTFRFSRKNLESRLAKGRVSRHQKRTFLQWILQLMVISFGYFPQGVPALDETVPVPGSVPAMDSDRLENYLRAELAELDAVLDQCRRKFGMERVAVHPLFGPLRVDQWRRFHVVHGLHHAKQLKRVRQQVAPQAAQGRHFDVQLAKELQVPAQRSLT